MKKLSNLNHFDNWFPYDSWSPVTFMGERKQGGFRCVSIVKKAIFWGITWAFILVIIAAFVLHLISGAYGFAVLPGIFIALLFLSAGVKLERRFGGAQV